jgi:hypothetical protein
MFPAAVPYRIFPSSEVLSLAAPSRDRDVGPKLLISSKCNSVYFYRFFNVPVSSECYAASNDHVTVNNELERICSFCHTRKSEVVPVLHWGPRREDIGSEVLAPCILNGTSQLHVPVALPRYPLCSRLGGLQSRVLDATEKRKISCPRRESNPDSSVIHPLPSSCSYWAIQAPSYTAHAQ